MVLVHAGGADEIVSHVTVNDVRVPFVEGSGLQRNFFVVRDISGRRHAYSSPHAYFNTRLEALRNSAHAARVARVERNRNHPRMWTDESSDDEDANSPEARTLAEEHQRLAEITAAWEARRDDAIARWMTDHSDELALIARECVVGDASANNNVSIVK